MARKRANGEGNIRKRSNGTWEMRITAGVNPETGKMISKSIYGRTQKEVREKLKALEEQKTEQTNLSPALPQSALLESTGQKGPSDEKEMTLSEWMDICLKNFLVDIDYGTFESYESIIRNHLKPAFGTVPLDQLHTAPIQIYYNKIHKNGLSEKYISNIHGCLHRILEMAVRLEYLKKNPSDACILPKIKKSEVTPLDLPLQKQLFQALKGHPLENLFLVDLFTGMREGELIGLTWECVDFENGIIHVVRQLVVPRRKGHKYTFGPPKNDKSRIIAPAPYVMELLKRQKESQEQQKKSLGDLWNEGEFPGLVFTRKDGSHLTHKIVYDQFRKILKTAGLEYHRVHDLRHTYAVNSLMAGDDIKTLQENLGHHSAAFTLDRYGHVTDTMRRESASKMQTFIAGIKEMQ